MADSDVQLSCGIVTGAGSGIGKETAFTFAERGSIGVVFADIDEAKAEAAAQASKQFAKNPNYRAVAVRVDVSDREQVKNAIDLTVKEFGRIDFACHCAGVTSRIAAPISELPTDVYRETQDVNAQGTFHITSEASRAMLDQDELFISGRGGRRSIGRGAIVNLSSAAGIWPMPGSTAYVASKFAAVGITKVAACDLARRGVRVNCVCPSWTDTPMMTGIIERKPGWGEKVAKMSPAGRMAKPEEVAEVIYFLSSPGASYVNGHIMAVDAGFTETKGFS